MAPGDATRKLHLVSNLNMRRRVEVDALRGLMLVWMTLTHLPTSISPYSYQPFGFISSAEGFIFLSALFTGLIYFRIAQRDGYREMRSRLWGRTLRLYWYHIVLVVSALVLLPHIAGPSRPGLHNLLDFYFFAGPKRALIDAVLLIYRPPLLDILPMYVLFLAATPVVITLAARTGWRYILGGSFAMWLMAQFGLRQFAYDGLHALGLQIPLNEMGAFDVWAWQLVWMLGLCCGVRWAQDDLPIGDWARKVTVPAAFAVAVLLTLRFSLNYGVDLGHFGPIFDKWHLGAARLIDFASIGALLIRFQPYLKRLAVQPLVILGQASLPVFCTHLLFCFFGLAIMRDHPTVHGWEQFALPVLTLLTLYQVAKKTVEGKNRRPVPRPGLAPATSR